MQDLIPENEPSSSSLLSPVDIVVREISPPWYSL